MVVCGKGGGGEGIKFRCDGREFHKNPDPGFSKRQHRLSLSYYCALADTGHARSIGSVMLV